MKILFDWTKNKNFSSWHWRCNENRRKKEEAIEQKTSKLPGAVMQYEGNTRDNGDIGNLENIARAMKTKGLCRENYQMSTCCLYCFKVFCLLTNFYQLVIMALGNTQYRNFYIMHCSPYKFYLCHRIIYFIGGKLMINLQTLHWTGLLQQHSLCVNKGILDKVHGFFDSIN